MSNEEPQAAPEEARPPDVPSLESAKETTAAASAGPLAGLMEVSMPVVVEMGRTHMTLEEVLKLDVGSVVELERMTGEPADVYVGDRKLAEGQVVVVGETFGVRITRIVGDDKGVART